MKKYILYFASGISFVLLVILSLTIYNKVYTEYKPLSTLIDVNEIDKVELKYFDESLNEKYITLNDEKEETFKVSLEKIKYQNVIKFNNLTSKECIVVTYKDSTSVSLNQYFVTTSTKKLEKNINIKDEDYSALLGVFYA